MMTSSFDRLFTVNIFKSMKYNRMQELQEIAALAATICETPVAMITLLDDEYNHFIAKSGLELTAVPADTSFCRYTVQQDNLMIVSDTLLDERFVCNPFVNGNPAVRFYAGASLHLSSGHNLGSLCVLDVKPKMLNDMQQKSLEVLSRQAMMLMELELSQKLLNEQIEEIETHNKRLINISNVQSHEFRGPVASMLGIMNIIRDDDYNAPREYLELMDETVRKLDEKIHLIVEYTQVL